MWIIYAMLGTLFGGINAVLAKVGVKEVNSHLATALRTVVIVIFSWVIVFAFGSHTGIADISGHTWIFLVASGLATGASWLCYLYALKYGTVSNVTPLKKSSTVLTIILAFLILQEPFGLPQIAGMLFIIAGTIFMLKKKDGSLSKGEGGANWLLFGLMAAFFASMRTIFGSIGIADVDANLGNAIRVVVVLLASWGIVFLTGNQKGITNISKKGLLFLTLSGLATGGNWLFFFRALQTGPVSVIVPIDKLSVIFNIIFAWVFLREKQSIKRIVGLACLIIGTLILVMLST
ncbi:MAG: EamA family transporter [Oscillospiraceae bacterium]|nr:EamA family transporter [Oscillospiraceae bacterium]